MASIGSTRGRHPSTWLPGLLAQMRIIHALMLRDALGRFGHHNFGFFWLVGEPLLLTCGIMFVWSIIGGSHAAEVGIIPFALTGYTFITLWRHIVARSQRIMRNNKNLKYHRQISYMDLLFAIGALECVGVFAAFIVGLVPLWVLGFCPGISDPLPLVGGFFFTAWFSLAFGMILAGLSEFSDLVYHFIPPLMYLTLPLTGSFFMVDWLPVRTQAVVMWSPLVNCIEMIRAGLFPAEIQTHFSASYLFICCFVLTAAGLYLCNLAERHVE